MISIVYQELEHVAVLVNLKLELQEYFQITILCFLEKIEITGISF